MAPRLERSIGLLQATAMVVGTIVGASIFVQPSEVSRAVPSLAGMLLVWLAAGALTWFGASICAELSSAMPRTGGVYVFLREMFSPACGFLWGWAMFWSMHSGIIAAIAMVFGRYAATIVPLGDLGVRLVAVSGILVLSAINYFGVRPGSAVQTGLTIAKIAAIAVLVVILFGVGTLRAPAAAGPIVYYAMAEDGLLFSSMGLVHPRFRTPYVAVIAQAIWSSVLVSTGTYGAIVSRVVYTEWIFFGALALGTMRLRRRPGYAAAFRAWGFPIVPAVFALVCFAIVANQVVSAPWACLTGLDLVLAGLPIYYLWRRSVLDT